MSEQNTQKKDQKPASAPHGLSAKERREAQAALRAKRKTRIYIAVAAVVAVLVAALLTWDSGLIQSHTTALTVGEESYTSVEVGYYFHLTYNNIYPYAAYYGLDTSVSLKDQEAYSGCTWYDYLLSSAKESLTATSILAQEGHAAGYEISEDGQAAIDSALASITEDAEKYGITESSVLKQTYGRYMTMSLYTKLLEESCYASDYAAYKTEGFEVTDEDLADYYTENADTVDTYDYECYRISATPATQKDEDGNTIEATEEDKAQALEDAAALAQELEDAFAAGDDEAVVALVEENSLRSYNTITPSGFSSYSFGEWLTDPERTAGDTTISEVTASGSDEDAESSITAYYVLKFNSRVRDDYYGVNLYNLQVNAEKIESDDEDAETTYDMDAALATITTYRDTWLQLGGDADEFSGIAVLNSADSNASDGGYTENVYKGSMDDVIDAWLFDGETRSAGDYEILEDTENHCYQLVYIDSFQEQYYWQTQAASAIRSERYNDWYTEVSKNYETSTTAFINTITT